MLGRFFWASASDYLGRKRTYAIFFGAGMLLYLSIPWIAQRVERVARRDLAGAVLRRDDADLHDVRRRLCHDPRLPGRSVRHAVRRRDPRPAAHRLEHGRRARARSAITALRAARRAAGHRPTGAARLARPISPPASALRSISLPLLVERKTVTIAKLLELAPAGTPDPSCTLYNSTMYLMAAPAGRRLHRQRPRPAGRRQASASCISPELPPRLNRRSSFSAASAAACSRRPA